MGFSNLHITNIKEVKVEEVHEMKQEYKKDNTSVELKSYSRHLTVTDMDGNVFHITLMSDIEDTLNFKV